MHFTLVKRRGVSPIISALLLVVIVLSGFTLLYAATNNWIRGQRRTEFGYLQERYVFEDVWFRTDGGTRTLVTLYIRNFGDVQITITECNINDGEYTITPSELDINPDTVNSLNVTFSWSPETTYEIELKTERRSFVTTFETA